MIVVLSLESELEIEPKTFPLEFNLGKAIGWLPVYATEEDARAEYPDAKLVEIREVK